MSKRFFAVLLSLFFVLIASPVAADADGVVRFATLPTDGPGNPEGIAADAAGRIYVSTFDLTLPPGATNVVYVFDRNGHLLRTIPLPGALPLGLALDAQGNLYVANLGGGNVLRFSAYEAGSAPQPPIQVCEGPPKCGLNALAFRSASLLYVSDSFDGRIFEIDVAAGAAREFAQDERLKPAPEPHGFPGFGANGLAFDASGAVLYVANTADDRVLLVNATAATGVVDPVPFAESINGADGLAFDSNGRLWVAANQADEVVALNNNGRVVERVGSFEGIDNGGAPKGLLFPASIVIKNGFLYVTNLAFVATARVGDEPEEDVRTYTVSRFRLPN